MKDALTIEITQETLTATIEAMQELQHRYEAEALVLSRMPSAEALELAQKRLEAARTTSSLFEFFIHQ